MATNVFGERVGRTLRGKWQLDALLGVGGMAAVYAATHRNGGRAAIKILHPELAGMREVRSRFVREGYLANRVGHAAVVRAIDDDADDDGTPFLVMELVDGETLAQRAEAELLNDAELLAVAAQVLPALVAGHGRGVIHHDLKPENLLVDGDGRVRVLDYGIARTVDDPSEALRVRSTGTPAFMSPEQVLATDDIGPLSDVYSLGATLFALATGRPPHVATTTMHLLVKITSERPPRVSTLAPDVSPLVAALIDRAIAREPDRRWASAAEMLVEVERIREDLQINISPLVLACRHGVTQPDAAFLETGSVRAMIVSQQPKRSKRSRAPWVAAGVLVAAMVGVAIGRARHPIAPPAAAIARAAEPPREVPRPSAKPVVSVVTVQVAAPAPAPLASASATATVAKPKRSQPATPAPFNDYKDSPY